MYDIMIHPNAIVETDKIGTGTRVWEFTKIMKGVVIGKNCNVGGGCFIEEGVVIGNNVVIKNGVSIWKGVSIEDDAFIGPGVVFTNETEPRSLCPKDLAQTVICKGASLGAGSILIAPVKVASYATIGAGSVVTKNVGPHQLVIGNPAKLKGIMCICGRKVSDNPDESKEGQCICGQMFRITDGIFSLLKV